MPVLSLQPLSAELIPAAVALDQLCLGGLWTDAGYQRELANPKSLHLVLSSPLAESQLPRLLGMGYAWSILDEAHVTLLAVHPDYRQQGFGQLLLLKLLHLAQQQGLERATLEVRVSNQAALGLYRKYGFSQAGRRKRYYPDTGEDALVLWRNGLQAPDFSHTLNQLDQRLQKRLSEQNWCLTSSLPCHQG